MIDLYSGTPGSGKSLHCAQVVIGNLNIGHPVICNFPINKNAVRKSGKFKGQFDYCPNDKLTPEYLVNFAREYWKGKTVKEEHILLVIDECQLMFNARDWGKKGRDKWLEFFTQHRKLGFHVILIAQMDGMLDKQIRGLIENEYIHRKLTNYGIKGYFLSALMLSPHLHVAVKVWYPMKEKVGQDFFRYKKRLSSLYDSYLTFE